MLAKMVLWNTEIVGDSQVMQMRKKKIIIQKVCLCAQRRSKVTLSTKGGVSPSGQDTREESQETREGSLGEKTFVEDIQDLCMRMLGRRKVMLLSLLS